MKTRSSYLALKVSSFGKLLPIAFVIIGFIYFTSCQKAAMPHTDAATPSLPATSFDYVTKSQQSPGGFSGSNNQGIAVSNEGATLGRVLFYDKKLSMNNATSCGSCHKQQSAFADNTAFSHGFETMLTKRNAPALTNPGMQWAYFWDDRVHTLDTMVLKPVANHIEMGMEDMNYLTKKLATYDYYAPLFQKAFGTTEITPEKISNALSQFLCSMTTAQSKYDEGMNSNFSNLNAQEEMGRDLFFNKLACAGCHSSPLMGGDGGWENIGLELQYKDPGIVSTPSGFFVFNGGFDDQQSTGPNLGPFFSGFFKIPSLRNVALTAPYMHDGRFKTLEEVIDFYDHGIQPNPGLSFLLTNGGLQGWNGGGGGGGPVFNQTGGTSSSPVKMNLNSTQKKALVAFLKTLTDETYITDVAYSDPFRKQ